MSKKPGDWWDKSWNPIEGCTKISEGCENCWAQSMLNRFRRGACREQYGLQPVVWPRRMAVPYHIIKPSRIFVCSLSDLFHGAIKGDVIVDIIEEMEAHPRHTFIVLTKRPGKAVDIHPLLVRWPPNAWFGISVENQARLDERLPYLIQIPAAVRFLHLEPLLGPVDVSAALPYVQWVVAGGENGPGARPMHPDWVRDIRDKCVAAGVRLWFKGWGTNEANSEDFRMNDGLPRTLEGNDLKGREWNELPGGGR